MLVVAAMRGDVRLRSPPQGMVPTVFSWILVESMNSFVVYRQASISTNFFQIIFYFSRLLIFLVRFNHPFFAPQVFV
jgi:hypothetical protein